MIKQDGFGNYYFPCAGAPQYGPCQNTSPATRTRAETTAQARAAGRLEDGVGSSKWICLKCVKLASAAAFGNASAETPGATKHDQDKLPLELVQPCLILGAARALQDGKSKHKEGAGLARSSDGNYASLMRHLLAWKDGEKQDPESKLSHLDHAAARLMFLMKQEEK